MNRPTVAGPARARRGLGSRVALGLGVGVGSGSASVGGSARLGAGSARLGRASGSGAGPSSATPAARPRRPSAASASAPARRRRRLVAGRPLGAGSAVVGWPRLGPPAGGGPSRAVVCDCRAASSSAERRRPAMPTIRPTITTTATTIITIRATRCRASRRLPVVLELEGHGLVELAQPADDPLELVPALAGHADGVALDLRLDLGELVADQLADLLRRGRRAGRGGARSSGGPCCRRPARPCPSRRSSATGCAGPPSTR